jgi:Tfp pilus assembly protein PilZ
MGVARDISLGGIFVETDMRLLLDEVVTLAFELESQPFKLHAEVVRVTETGFGMKFTIEPGQQDFLQQYLERL